MTERLRLGTRGSPLALAQAELVRRALRRTAPGTDVEIVPVRTAGDRTQRSYGDLDFTDEIDRRLEAGDVDLAVHSAKDLPARVDRKVLVAAYLRRADPRDCVVLRRPGPFASLPRGARLGSSSLRRRAQLLALRPDLEIVPVRGNVGTRIEKIESERLDGVVLAAAGLLRLGWGPRISGYLPTALCLPAPGQGAVAVEVRARDRTVTRTVSKIDHLPTRYSVEAERTVVETLGGDCTLPLGALARIRGARLALRAVLFSADGRLCLEAERSAAPSAARRLGRDVGRALSAFPGTGKPTPFA